MSAGGGGQGGAAIRGLRLVTMDRGPEGYGFHMYTNKTLKGQFVKWVSPNGPADLGGMLPGDHVIEVDGANVMEESHQKVVERIRQGNGRGKKILVVDRETEQEMVNRGEALEFHSDDALVMIPRAPIQSPTSEGVTNPLSDAVASSNTGADQVDGPTNPSLALSDMSAALPPKRSTKRADVKNRDWRASIQAYNEL